MKLRHRPLLRSAALVTLGSALLAGCVVAPVHRAPPPAYSPPPVGYAEPAPGGYYGGNESGYGGRYADVRYGTVAAIEPLGNQPRSSGAGAIAGGLIGGVIGHEIGRDMGGPRGDGGKVGAVLGAVGGAVIGDQIERDGSRGPAGYRVWIRLDGGGDQNLQLANPGDLRVGERVRLADGQLQRLR
ncbi:glycine zipper 2TM domain-containing protein [Roseateles saccharophilus]|uniref:Glycine zipper 2TM protein n=1 Tax=Roseateles saccharophilus TaxID=304 RepID=A0A4R3VE05_ROSSA|nr:glycine zipper 2TM domain-containing protein [Roseateles saccharophilus]MDG0835527.1 glycine zipper 2TM domain-containing protein [Roseateles saccharophilus]TCV03597.1 glycine zipper 2TM protein [Roseateles saccharophilus]